MAGNDVDDLYLSVVGGEVASDADHDFVASAREGVPTLLAEVEQLRELLGEGGETKTAGVAGDAAVTAGPGQNLGLTDQQLTELKKLSGEATPGPWRSQVAGRDDWLESNLITTAAEPLSLSGATVADQDFIASARQDVPELLAEIERLQRALRNHLD